MLIAKDKIKITILTLFIFIMIFSYVSTSVVANRIKQVNAQESFPLDLVEQTSTYANGMCVIEAESGRVLYQKNSKDKFAMASTTKIMTALVALKNCKNLDEKFIVHDESIGIEGTSLYLRKGEEKTLRELLYGLMLPSGNDAAIAIAYRIAGSEEKFVNMMNEEAKLLNLKNTSFSNPHGLDAEGHYTSAYDLAKITAEAMKNETFCEIVKTKNIRISGNKEVAAKELKNKNKLWWNLEGCEGVKTGFTDNAKRCFVCSAERGGMRLICVVLNCGPMFEEAERLINMGFENFKKYTLLKSYQPNNKIPVVEGEKSSVDTYTVNNFTVPLTIDEYKNIEYDIELPKEIKAPIEKEQELGELRIKLNDTVLFKEKIYSMDKVESTKFFDKVEKITNYWNM